MSDFQTLLADVTRQQNEAADLARTVGLLKYVEDNCRAHRVPLEIEWTPDNAVVLTLDLNPVQQVTPPDVPLSLPAPVADEEVKPKPVDRPRRPSQKNAKKAAPVGGFVTGAFSQEEIATIYQMLDEGATTTPIAKALNRKPKAVGVSLVRFRKMRAEIATQEGTVAKPADKPEPDRSGQKTDAKSKDVPAPVMSRPVRAAKGQAVPFDDSLPFANRTLTAHLDAVGYVEPWSAGLDLDLVEHLLGGTSVANAAVLLEVTPDQVKGRWKLLNRKPGDLDHQKVLVAVLKSRAGMA